jgi:hypothetical protein
MLKKCTEIFFERILHPTGLTSLKYSAELDINSNNFKNVEKFTNLKKFNYQLGHNAPIDYKKFVALEDIAVNLFYTSYTGPLEFNSTLTRLKLIRVDNVDWNRLRY